MAAVTISPAYAQLAPGQSLTFTSNTPNVIWQVNNGNGSGVTTSGVYTAPESPPSPAVVTISAVSPTNAALSATAVVTLLPAPLSGTTYYVSTKGKDSNPGTLAAPFATLQHGASVAAPGDTVLARAGVFNQLLTLTASGTTSAPITFASYPGETAIIDGTNLPIPNGQNGLITLNSVSDIIIEGFTLRNYTTKTVNDVPIGIYVTGAGDGVQIMHNHVTAITTTAPTNPNACSSNALGITVYGTQAPAAITNLVIAGNTVNALKTGCSETVSLDGNVDGFSVLANQIYNDDNIGIDAIGFEKVSPNPSYDQARNGDIRGNLVYNITSYGNPDYGKQYAADGIYVDGGTEIIIEQNVVHNTDLGIELASEHRYEVTSAVIARNNLVYHSNSAGISIGGYGAVRGGTQNVSIVNNSLYANDTKRTGSGEFQIQYNASSNVFMNNILDAGSQCLLVNSFTVSASVPAAIDYNDYDCALAAAQTQFTWQSKSITGFAAWQSASGQDVHSFFANPDFVGTAAPNLDVTASSPALGVGENLGVSLLGAVDFAGNPRIGSSGAVTIGAYQDAAP